MFELSPQTVPEFRTFGEVQQFLEQELSSLSRLLRETKALDLRPSYAEPQRPQPGMLVYADGVEWNPGKGEGLYERTLAGTWLRLFDGDASSSTVDIASQQEVNDEQINTKAVSPATLAGRFLKGLNKLGSEGNFTNDNWAKSLGVPHGTVLWWTKGSGTAQPSASSVDIDVLTGGANAQTYSYGYGSEANASYFIATAAEGNTEEAIYPLIWTYANLTVTVDFAVQGLATFQKDVAVQRDLAVTRDAKVHGKLNVDGPMTAAGGGHAIGGAGFNDTIITFSTPNGDNFNAFRVHDAAWLGMLVTQAHNGDCFFNVQDDKTLQFAVGNGLALIQFNKTLGWINNKWGVGVAPGTERLSIGGSVDTYYVLYSGSTSKWTEGVEGSVSDRRVWASGGNYRMILTAAGGLSTTSGTLGTISDVRLKEDMKRLDESWGLPLLRQLDLIEYKPRLGEGRLPGLSAQQMEKLRPELVTRVGPVADVDDALSLNYIGLVPSLILAVRQLERRVVELENGNAR